MDHTYTYIGRDAPVNDAAAKATGQLAYAADLHLPGMLYMKLLLSPVAHGLVRSLDTSAALALPGVAAVLSFQNTPSVKYNRGRVRATDEAPDQETLFTDHVRFVGDRIAAVVAQTPEIAQQAVSLLRADIQPLPPVFNLAQALEGAPVPLHERDDIIHLPVVSYGDYASAQGEEFCHHTATQRVSHIAMETHCAVADYTPATGRMTVWTATQSVFGVRSAISTILDLPMSRIRVIKTPMGGSFGCKQEMILEPLAACAAKMTGRPVMLHFSRSEVMLCTMLKHPLESDIKVKFSPQRTITGLQLHCRLDAGAYQTVSPDYAGSISKKLSWVYNIPHMEYYGTTVCTNTPTTGSYRGWGGPEAAIIMENMMNAAARHFSMDPIELRLRNILPPYAISRINNFSLGNLPLEDALLLGRERFAWEERKARLAVQDRSGRYARGIGMALSTHTSGYFPRKGDWGTVVVKMEEDGSVCVNCNVHDHGCGEVAVFKAIVGEVLSISPELVDLPEGDTAYNALDNGCYTSRSIYVLGRAILDASKKLLEQLRRNAGELLGCLPEQLSHKDGRFFVTKQPQRGCTYSQVAYYVADKGTEALFVAHTHVPVSNPGPVAAHFAEVEVDTYTGLCQVIDYLAVHDVGKALNPALCRGQVGSALQQGMGLVFCEELKLDPKTGRALNADLQRYHVARAYDLPNLDVLFLEKPDEEGPFGAKSVGESCYVPVAPALIAAVNDALDLELSTLPLEPAHILSALDDKQAQREKGRDTKL